MKNGLELTVENVRRQPRHHPRCGTSFLFVVIFVSILFSGAVFGIWPITNVWLRTLVHLLLLPLVVGVTYEFNRWVGAARPGEPPGENPDGPGHVDAEFHHQRAGRQYDCVRDPVFGAGASRRAGQGCVVSGIPFDNGAEYGDNI